MTSKNLRRYAALSGLFLGLCQASLAGQKSGLLSVSATVVRHSGIVIAAPSTSGFSPAALGSQAVAAAPLTLVGNGEPKAVIETSSRPEVGFAHASNAEALQGVVEVTIFEP